MLLEVFVNLMEGVRWGEKTKEVILVAEAIPVAVRETSPS